MEALTRKRRPCAKRPLRLEALVRKSRPRARPRRLQLVENDGFWEIGWFEPAGLRCFVEGQFNPLLLAFDQVVLSVVKCFSYSALRKHIILLPYTRLSFAVQLYLQYYPWFLCPSHYGSMIPEIPNHACHRLVSSHTWFHLGNQCLPLFTSPQHSPQLCDCLQTISRLLLFCFFTIFSNLSVRKQHNIYDITQHPLLYRHFHHLSSTPTHTSRATLHSAQSR